MYNKELSLLLDEMHLKYEKADEYNKKIIKRLIQIIEEYI